MSRRRAGGFALIAALFLLVALGALAYYLSSLAGTQQFTTLWAVQGSRAHYAAQSGLQWGIQKALTDGTCNGTLQIDAGAPSPFDVDITCSGTPYTELGEETTLWSITAEATYGAENNPGFVRREFSVTVIE